MMVLSLGFKGGPLQDSDISPPPIEFYSSPAIEMECEKSVY